MKVAPPRRGPPVFFLEGRSWLPMQASQNFDHNLKPLSKKAQTTIRHGPHLREPDGAVYPKTRSWRQTGVTFEDCLDPHGEPQCIRSNTRSQWRTIELNHSFFTLHEFPYEWNVDIYHTVSSHNHMSIAEGGEIAGGTSDRRGRQACFFSAMDLLEEPLPDFTDFPTNNTQWCTTNSQKDQFLMLCAYLTSRSHRTED